MSFPITYISHAMRAAAAHPRIWTDLTPFFITSSQALLQGHRQRTWQADEVFQVSAERGPLSAPIQCFISPHFFHERAALLPTLCPQQHLHRVL